MTNNESDAERAERLEALARHLEEVVARTETALHSASDLGNFQISINKQEDPENILALADGKVRQVLNFLWTSFFLFNEADANLYLTYCNPHEDSAKPEAEFDHLLNNRALDLEETRPVFVTSSDGKRKLLVRVLATESRIRGLFLGLPATPFNEIHDSTLALVSLILLNCANTIESLELYRMNRRSLEELRESEERYRLLANSAHDVIWAMDDQRVVTYVSPSCRHTLKCTEEEFRERLLDSLFTRHSQELLRSALDRCLDSSLGFEERLELEVVTGEDQATWTETLLCRVKESEGRHRVMGVMRDISQRKKYESKLKYQAMHDPLTDLPNRLLFIDRLEQAMARSHRWEEYRFAVMMIDLDDYKHVNDNFGHHTGDLLLRTVSRRIQDCVREVDTVARFGGDEFAVLLDEFRYPAQVVHVAHRIKKEVARPYTMGNETVRISCSLGLVYKTEDYRQHEDILRDADISMYHAKEQGGNRMRAFKKELRERHMHSLLLERDLHEAIRTRSFELHYQPVYELKGDRLLGFEALVRWRHPTKGLVQPADFITFSEKGGAILQIGEIILDMACAKLASFRDAPETKDLFISVNVSGRQMSSRLPHVIEAVLRKHGVDPRKLKIELTETAIMENLNLATELFEKVRELGVRVAIDDFGTGYSSLAYLQNFSVDFLKVDRSFISRLNEGGERDVRMVRAIAALAATLGYEIIAEGVELVEQRDLLREMGCYAGQGFYYSKPVAGDSLAGFFQTPGIKKA